jgi:serine/threonine protein kinase
LSQEERKSAVEDIKEELGLLQKLNHQNIVRILSFNCSDGLIVLLMDVHDTSLRNFLRKRKKKSNGPILSIEEVQEFCRQMIEGLTYLHNNKISHRNMKVKCPPIQSLN